MIQIKLTDLIHSHYKNVKKNIKFQPHLKNKTSTGLTGTTSRIKFVLRRADFQCQFSYKPIK